MSFLRPLFSAFLTLIFAAQTALAAMPKWSYDPGPDPKTKMGQELINITAEIPNMPEISMQVMGDQKFRPAFGPVPWRMLQGQNKVKILFIGQDATHIAEAAGRPATAGFGGRAQDLAAYFGVNEGAAFINTYAFTIQGQYGAYETPYIFRKDGKDEVRFSNLVENKLWLISQDLDSPVVKWRNDLIDWIIRNNKDSLKLIVTFGGAARDAMGSFVESKGGKVGGVNSKNMDKIQIAETALEYAGGNNEFPILINQEGGDLYSAILGKKLDYTKLENQALVKKELKENSGPYLADMVFTKGGPKANGLIHPAQLGGYDLNQIEIKKQITRSLKGIKLNDGSDLNKDLLVVELPHPTFLSNLKNDEASKAVGEDLQVLEKYVKAGWKIPADEGMINNFAKGNAYKYARANIGPEYYDFGTPGTRMVPVSSASRMGGYPHVIIFGTRDRAKFNKSKIDEMTNTKPNESFSSEELFTTRPRSLAKRYTFDPGPGATYARLMKESLEIEKVFKIKSGKTWDKDGIEAHYVKSHPELGDFGHYRGTFKNPKVIIVADPDGYDDLITARALTGTRGQYLQGAMNDLGVNEDYLVIKTVPFGMDGASKADWDKTLELTENYRSALLSAVLKDTKPVLIIADGAGAKATVDAFIGKNKTPVVYLERSKDVKSIAKLLSTVKEFKGKSLNGKMANIPRSHLSFYARTWEGTSGDRVIGSDDSYRGYAFAVVAPAWAWKQEQKLNPKFEDVRPLIKKLEKNNLPLPGEKIPSFIKRLNINPSLTFIETVIKLFKVA